MFKKLFLFLLITLTLHSYEFKGIHYLASFMGCNAEIIKNEKVLTYFMREACMLAGAQVVDCCGKVFDNGGCTICVALEESHATMHSYPEHKAVFIDLFTCGDSCDHFLFVQFLAYYLEPDLITSCLIERSTENKLVE